MSKTIYLTTPLYYVNAAPHIGHSYTTVAADALARFHRLKDEPVFLLTGTDEHGQKIAQAAAGAGSTPEAFVDGVVTQFQSLWKTLHIRYDDFIRTTEARHTTAVQRILTKLRDEGKLKRSSYQGWYCTPCETFWTEAELHLKPGTTTVACGTCGRMVEPVKEDGWHLPLRPSQDWLVGYLRSHPGWIRPESRSNELASLLEQPLPESLCITRPKSRVSWGISVPFDPDHVVYVWFDALLNYITVPGYPDEPKRFTSLWPAEVHFIGKDILRHHALYWPIMLHALGLEMPKQIIAHGWWKIGEQKMSKSLGNIVDPTAVLSHVLKGQPYAADIYRYFLLREVPFGQDGSFSEEALLTRFAADLANDLGNLVNRTLSMIERYCAGVIPAQPAVGCAVDDEPLRRSAMGLGPRIGRTMEERQYSAALEAIMRVVSQANRYIEAVTPWQLAKHSEQSKRLHGVLGVLAEVIRIVAIGLEPFMPTVAAAIWEQLGCRGVRRFQDAGRWAGLSSGQRIGPHPVLFPKPEPS